MSVYGGAGLPVLTLPAQLRWQTLSQTCGEAGARKPELAAGGKRPLEERRRPTSMKLCLPGLGRVDLRAGELQ